MIRVLHIVSRMDRAGQESLIMNIYRNIDRTKIQFDFLCSSDKKGDFDDEIRLLGGNIYHLSKKITLPHLHNISIVKGYKEFFSVHDDYDIVHIHNYHAFSVLVQLIGLKLSKVKNIVVHSHNSFAPNPKIHNLSKSLINLFNISRLACSDIAGKWMYGTKSFRVINNGIQVKNYKFSEYARCKIRDEFGIAENEKILCHIGRFNYQKNHKFLLDVFREILNQSRDYKLLLVGQGELELNIKDYAKSLGIDRNIIFAGVRSDITDILSGSDVFILPSLFEGLGIVMIEAQANGIPIVCSNVIPSEALICENIETISLYAPLEKWAKAVRLQADKNHDAENYKKVIAAGFNIAQTSENITVIYKSITNHDR